eukprot:TRINITY_DN2851_c0_g2_i1.p1 TRINITY_DN2851_c0_g2~~TRINITY_DN2851_c0_g2_i1.p1  ORF type:complete len:103 (-),score=10.44 TRINITY_DN2851_c0_g2_i1:74-382(-)
MNDGNCVRWFSLQSKNCNPLRFDIVSGSSLILLELILKFLSLDNCPIDSGNDASLFSLTSKLVKLDKSPIDSGKEVSSFLLKFKSSRYCKLPIFSGIFLRLL